MDKSLSTFEHTMVFCLVLAGVMCTTQRGGRGTPSVSSALCLGGCWKGVGFTRTPWLWKAVIGGNIAVLACLLWSRSSTARSHPARSGSLPPSPRTGPSRTHTYSVGNSGNGCYMSPLLSLSSFILL